MRREVDAVRQAVRVGLVAGPLLVEHVQLHLEVAVEAAAARGRPDLLEDVDQLEADELIADAVAVLELGRGDDEAVDEGQQHRLVLVVREAVGAAQLLDNDLEDIRNVGVRCLLSVFRAVSIPRLGESL